MKFKSFNRVLAALLMLTMLAGQVLMSTAMALNEEPGIVILDESDLLEAEPTPTPAENRRRAASCLPRAACPRRGQRKQ